MAATIETTNTAPAEISLASFALGCCLFVNESTTASMEAFVSSREMTKPIKMIKGIQSVLEILRKNPKIMEELPLLEANDPSFTVAWVSIGTCYEKNFIYYLSL